MVQQENYVFLCIMSVSLSINQSRKRIRKKERDRDKERVLKGTGKIITIGQSG